MEAIKKQYIVDENNNKVGVQLDLKTFEKIEEIMENYALFQLMKEDGGEEVLDLQSAKEYYSKLDKKDWTIISEEIYKRSGSYSGQTKKLNRTLCIWRNIQF